MPKGIYKRTEENKRNIGLACKGKSGRKIGYSHTAETRKKMSLSGTGDKNSNWKGGVSPINHRIRESAEYKDWRTAVFKRDDYTCQECGSRGYRLQVDHIKPFAYFPELRLVIENGRTLCVECHQKTETYGGKIQTKNAYQLLINK